MPEEQIKTPKLRAGASPRSLACFGCLAAVVLVILAGILLFAIAFRKGSMPESIREIKKVSVCRENMIELTSALKRFDNQHHKFPERLEELYPDYLKSGSLLKCPADSSKEKTTSYEYKPPVSRKNTDDIVLICRHHKPVTGVIMILESTLGGRVDVKTYEEGKIMEPKEK